jgi:hypothetical protein
VQNPKIIVTDESILSYGTSQSEQIASYSRSIDNMQQEISLPDIEISDFNIQHITIDYVEYQENEFFAWGYFFDTEITVKNNGSDTVHTFAIYSEFHGGMNCVSNIFYQKFSDIEILPNASLTVELNSSIFEEGINNNTLCFECMAPNSNLESDYKNNILCKSFTITGIDEYNKNNEIRIYPNPTTNIISIAIDCDGLKSVQILNLNGILLIEETFKGNQKTIDISGLNTGAYLISIKTEDDRNVQKLIKK